MSEAHVALLAWSVVVGLDLISVGQFLLSRPLVAGVVAGAILGDPAVGGAVGIVFELFALDWLPIGAVRYPDYGLGAVIGTAAVSGAPYEVALGVGVVTGLVAAVLGGVGSHLVRQANASATARIGKRIAVEGSPAVTRLHLTGFARDVVRAVLAGTIGLGLAWAARVWLPVDAAVAVVLSLLMVGCALGTAVSGALRVSASPSRAHAVWLAAGIVLGVGLVVL